MASDKHDAVAAHHWIGNLFDTVEDFRLARRGADWVLSGTVTGAHGLAITYEVVADSRWTTRFATFDAEVGGLRRAARLERGDGDSWRVDGEPADALDGCAGGVSSSSAFIGYGSRATRGGGTWS